ncbi:hypothetical protein F7984_13470 [Pradoshia sp. D12]|uniref:YqhG family protein n=1 Tax=Bacillaceae TaxID=186817 RepID=UPI00112C0AC2|nr:MULTISPECIES: YqhG family protein [Bacillaceae]QFK72173.1 hypothetical protein F7984_13470 [Pradoshia sp. D12]TPF71335.1 hypothetical protein FHY44_12730 [Bacillus sp. D12]
MQQQEILEFLVQFFTANQCEIINQGPGHLTVQLTIDMDKELMNRPFYWHYLEKVGGVPNPMSLTFILDKEAAPPDLKGEFIHFGSPRLHQIFAAAQRLSKHIRLFEEIKVTSGQMPLFPWLGVNVNISYECDRKKDLFFSIGLNLINGLFVENFIDSADKLSLTPKISDYTFTLTPIIRYQSGLHRIKTYIQNKINQDDHGWADEALVRWNKDLSLLNHFYEDKKEEETHMYDLEKEALRMQYEPRIRVSFINGGLFYLSGQAI